MERSKVNYSRQETDSIRLEGKNWTPGRKVNLKEKLQKNEKRGGKTDRGKILGRGETKE